MQAVKIEYLVVDLFNEMILEQDLKDINT